jgi:hypothetical protein
MIRYVEDAAWAPHLKASLSVNRQVDAIQISERTDDTRIYPQPRRVNARHKEISLHARHINQPMRVLEGPVGSSA